MDHLDVRRGNWFCYYYQGIAKTANISETVTVETAR